MSVITRVIVYRKTPYTPLLAWVVADYLQEIVEQRVGRSYVGSIPPIIDRLIGRLETLGETPLSEKYFLRVCQEVCAPFPRVDRMSRDILDHLHYRFWLER